jgi:hypothetical protein
VLNDVPEVYVTLVVEPVWVRLVPCTVYDVLLVKAADPLRVTAVPMVPDPTTIKAVEATPALVYAGIPLGLNTSLDIRLLSPDSRPGDAVCSCAPATCVGNRERRA